MFYYVNGPLALLSPDRAVIDCAGVGYLLYITKQTYSELVSRDAFSPDGTPTGVPVKLYTHYHVREDAAELYGFFSERECELFRLLISVSGVGPKAGLAVLSALTPDAFVRAVLSQDAKAISAAQGVGLKSAQKIILELKDKLSHFPTEDGEAPVFQPQDEPDPDMTRQAVDALTVLGYSRSEAVKAVRSSSGATLEDLIRSALSHAAE